MGKYRESILNRRLIEVNEENDKLRKLVIELRDENEELKKQNDKLVRLRISKFKAVKKLNQERHDLKEQLKQLEENYELLQDNYDHLFEITL